MDVSDGRDEILLRGRACFSPSGFRTGTLLLTGRDADVGVVELPLGCGAEAGTAELPLSRLGCRLEGACDHGASGVCWVVVVIGGG